MLQALTCHRPHLSFSCCSFEEADPTVSAMRKQKLRLLKHLMTIDHQSSPHKNPTWLLFLPASDGNQTVLRSFTGEKPRPCSPLTHTFRFPAPLSGSCLISGIAPLPCVICHSSGVGGAAVYGHPRCLQLRLNGGTAL